MRRGLVVLALVLGTARGAVAQAVPPAAADTKFHDSTAYPLTGRHVQVACAACHDPKRPKSTRWKPVPHDRCDRCHRDPHRGETSPDCEHCHDLAGFRPARFERDDHARTHFALSGAHQAVPCASCHPRPPASPGFKRGVLVCEDCHVDEHEGQFAGQSGGCLACHDQAAWAPSTFDRAAHARTGFALTGKHDVACSRCHAAAAAGLTVHFVGLPADCGACHQDGHLGQLAGKPCASCHAGASFTPASRFDHAATRAPLRGRHARTSCQSCHPRAAAPAGETEIYRLGVSGRDCSACHRAQHGDAKATPLARSLAAATRACGDCHDERSWSRLGRPAAFDHDLTGARLVGGHALSSCSGCHQPARGRIAALADCSACHQDRHGGRASDRCESCHSPASWKPDATLVDHQRTRLPLVGAHAVQGCITCHKQTAAGDYRGLDPSCTGCHQHTLVERRPHPDHTGAAFAACQDCHSSLAWRPAQVDHDRFFRLTGAHTRVACAQCHTNTATAPPPTVCAGCHSDDLASAGFDHSGLDTTRCQACHDTAAWRPARLPEHARLFPLAAPHDLACTSCHTTPRLLRSFTCTACHAHQRTGTDAAHAQVPGYSFDSSQCLRCHPRGGSAG